MTECTVERRTNDLGQETTTKSTDGDEVAYQDGKLTCAFLADGSTISFADGKKVDHITTKDGYTVSYDNRGMVKEITQGMDEVSFSSKAEREAVLREANFVKLRFNKTVLPVSMAALNADEYAVAHHTYYDRTDDLYAQAKVKEANTRIDAAKANNVPSHGTQASKKDIDKALNEAHKDSSFNAAFKASSGRE